MSVRKRKWVTGKGVVRTAWIVDYTDGSGVRRQKTFNKNKDADAFAATTHDEVRHGMHVAESATVTVAEAGELWIASTEKRSLEGATVANYRQHLDLHIAPFIGRDKLSKLNVSSIRAFEDQLRSEGRSPRLVKRILGSLGMLLADAQERGGGEPHTASPAASFVLPIRIGQALSRYGAILTSAARWGICAGREFRLPGGSRC